MNYPGSNVEIKLYSPLTLADGSKLEKVTMREPLVRDRIEYVKRPGSDAEKEIGMLADLCGMNVEDVYQLTAADYYQLEAAWNNFLLPPGERQKATSDKL
ncbi:hypothetical protein CLM71_10195 [Serratia sp. MYb239]|uniref:phage tail assembly protein n=1 Tax=Serratia sp. MYb239 TaxID=2033438 RepID=UPI000CF5E45C|nr:phage tail assembly protein [Serratia sp. MYb239]AVJ17483.1 hypothetical protein CLM71_10195 [Serratia sp. MYb239]